MDGPVVTTTYGKIEGYEEDELKVFKGIPYAASTAGPNRWLPPRPPGSWGGVRQAKEFGPIAPQSEADIRRGLFLQESPPQSEDCLCLNIWTPGIDNGKRPVLFWVHGGAFSVGFGSQPLYDGRWLAKRGNAVVVTINYRLGLLGFLNLYEVTGGRIPATGNEGLLDQIAALRWVKDNIAAFGGDPGNVTIFGESAGGMSCGCLLAMPEAMGLFHRAILQSGAASSVQSLDNARQSAERFIRTVSPGGDLERLRSLTASHVVRIQEASFPMMSLVPTIDGKTLPSHPLEAIRHGASQDIPLLVGSNLDEWSITSLEGMDPAILGLTEKKAAARLSEILQHVPRAMEAYRRIRAQADRPTTPGDVYIGIETDVCFRQPAIRLSEAKRKHRSRAFHYIFTWPSPMLRGRLGACHAVELGFLFGTHNKIFHGEGPAVDALSKRVQNAWLAFARTGDPSCAAIGEWPPYGARRETMILGETCHVAGDPYREERQIWEHAPDDEVGSPRSFLMSFPVEYTDYVDTANKLSFSQADYWTMNATSTAAPVVAWFSSPDWSCPGVVVRKNPESDATSLSDLITKVIHKDDAPVISAVSQQVNRHDYRADTAVFKYKSKTGAITDAKVFGFRTNNSWWTMEVYQQARFGTLENAGADRIFESWRLLE